MKIVVVGGGVIGLCSAYYLQKNGHQVTIIEQSSGQEGCSFGNAGMIVPSHFIPLAAPGMIEKGIRWMFDSESPFYVKPRLNLDLLSWGIKFYQSSTQKQVEKASPILRDISFLSKKLYQELAQQPDFDFSFEEKGLLLLCKTAEAFDEECHVAQQAHLLGIKADVLSVREIHQLEPQIKPDVLGAVYYKGDAHCYPNIFIKNLKQTLYNQGVKFLYDTEVVDFGFDNKTVTSIKIKQHSTTHLLKTDQLIIATGSWSQGVAKMLHLGLPMQAGKGYSITNNQIENQKLQIPSILVEARVAITPMADNFIRFGGTMEIGGINTRINMNRVKGIVKAVPQYFPDYQLNIPQPSQVWHGLRPCSPDGLPYIGRTKKYTNLTIATGHAMMGLSLAPATGQLISEVINNQKPSMDLTLFSPDRF
jgi:D-amino-acid dehydrogenase